MTRRKWIKLRRDMPELFKGFEQDQPWEVLTPAQVRKIRQYSKRDVIGILSAFRLSHAGETVSRVVR